MEDSLRQYCCQEVLEPKLSALLRQYHIQYIEEPATADYSENTGVN